MATATERVPVLMTPNEKKRVITQAKKAGVTMGEFMRRAAATYQPGDDDKALIAMIDAMNKASERAEQAIDETLAFVIKSNKRIQAMEAKAKRDAA